MSGPTHAWTRHPANKELRHCAMICIMFYRFIGITWQTWKSRRRVRPARSETRRALAARSTEPCPESRLAGIGVTGFGARRVCLGRAVAGVGRLGRRGRRRSVVCQVRNQRARRRGGSRQLPSGRHSPADTRQASASSARPGIGATVPPDVRCDAPSLHQRIRPMLGQLGAEPAVDRGDHREVAGFEADFAALGKGA